MKNLSNILNLKKTIVINLENETGFIYFNDPTIKIKNIANFEYAKVLLNKVKLDKSL